ncbi:MAG: hypothetical protein WC196_05515 [Bacilli bacterium]
MKDQTGKEIAREFAPNKRNPNDKYKVTVVKKEPDYDVTQDDTKRPIVTKKGDDEEAKKKKKRKWKTY